MPRGHITPGVTPAERNRRQGRSGRPWQRVRAQVLAESGGICWLCGQPGATTVDHVAPLSRSEHGALDPANLRAAHSTCNSARGNRTTTQPSPHSRQW